MNKFLLRSYNVGIIASFFGSIIFTFVVLPYLFSLTTAEVDNILIVKWIYYIIVIAFHAPFGYALSQVFMILSLLNEDDLFKEQVIDRLQKIIYSGLAIGCLHLLGLLLMIILGNYSELLGMLSIMVFVVSLIVSSFTYLLSIIMEKSITIKIENDLTI
ncbi:MAG: DUF2975 domain-containing protein [Candidatus Izimaplasma sp.]|nr:DUF2975 domain-containing protein [Candidatus Izimaplasma bacterium]